MHFTLKTMLFCEISAFFFEGGKIDDAMLQFACLMLHTIFLAKKTL